MDCADLRIQLQELRRGRLDAAAREVVLGHLEGCQVCRRAEAAEAVLDGLLEEKAPRFAAPPGLQERLEALVAPAAEPHAVTPPLRPLRSRWRALPRLLAPAMAAGLAVALSVVVVGQRAAEEARAHDLLTAEVVNDHLRLLAESHPLDVQSGGQHQVKPWFQGRLDFAPAVPGGEGTALELLGGSVGYVHDRKAAVMSYRLRLHQVTLLAFRAGGLAWPAEDLALGAARGHLDAARGYHVVLWRAGELGYALVSDVGAVELVQVAAVLAPATAP